MTGAAQATTYSTTLPRAHYLSPATFESEVERVFFRQWTFVAHESQVPGAGDYLVDEIAGESIIVVRDGAGDLHAFFNVCRHRGYRFCEQPHGHAARFTCPYHRWSYGPDGRLRNVPGSPDGELLDYSEWGLVPAHLERWHGFVFVALGETAPAPLSSALDLLGADMLPARPERLALAFSEAYEVRANWKILLENYLECYHCPGQHPELCSSMALDAMYATTAGWAGAYLGGSTPLKPGHLTMSLDGGLVSTPLGDFADVDVLASGLGGGFMIVPFLSRIICHVDHVIAHVIRPIDAGRTRWVTQWYVNDCAVAGVDFDVDELTRVWRTTNRQDVALCEGAQLGVASRRYLPGPLHPQRESAIATALDVYRELMDEAP